MKENSRFFAGFSLLYGIMFSYFCYQNVNGIGFLGQVILTIILSRLFIKKLNPQICFTKAALPYEIGILLLGISTIRTDSGFLIFFNWIGIMLLFFAEMMNCFCKNEDWTFWTYGKNIVIMGFRSLGCSYHIFERRKTNNDGLENVDNLKKKKMAVSIILGSLSAMLLLAVVLPLLASSDVVFKELLSGIFHVPQEINFGSILTVCIMAALGTLIFYGVFYAFYNRPCKMEKEKNLLRLSAVSGMAFTAILAFVYILYCMVQVIFLFLKSGGGLPSGVTYSEYAREGFWQLLFVGIINFILVLVCMSLFEIHKILQGILTVICGCTFIMTASAMYRMFLYVKEYHMTFLRVLVLWFLVLLILLMAGVVVNIYRARFPLFQYVMAVGMMMYILLSFLRPDYISVSYNIEHMDKIKYEDTSYMMYNSSYDAASALSKIDLNDIEYTDSYEKMCLEEQFKQYFQNACEEIKNSSLRQFNFSTWEAAKLAK